MAEEVSKPLAKATIILSAEEQLSVSVSKEDIPLSAALVELKGECMKFLGDHLLRRNTPLEEPDVVLEESVSEEEDYEDDRF